MTLQLKPFAGNPDGQLAEGAAGAAAPGAEASGIDIRRPLSPEQVRAIEDAMDRYAVLVFRNQPLDQDQQIRLAQSFGPLDLGLRKVKGGPHRFKYAELADISNVTADGEVAAREHAKIVGNVANQLWHSDSSFQRPRAKYSMLSAVVVPPEGGETEFADLRSAYDALPPWRKRQVANLTAVHYALHSRFLLGDTNYTEEQRKAIPPARWPLVQTDPRSGRKILYVGIHACEIDGMTDGRRPDAADGPARARHPAPVRLSASLAAGRPGDLGQHGHRASRPVLRFRAAAGAAQGDDGGGHGLGRSAGGGVWRAAMGGAVRRMRRVYEQGSALRALLSSDFARAPNRPRGAPGWARTCCARSSPRGGCRCGRRR